MTSSFKSLRYTTAIAVSLVAISTANQANAACDDPGTAGADTVACTGASTAIDLQGGADVLTNAAGGTLDGVGDIAIQKTGGTLNLTNDGTITNAADANNEATVDIHFSTTSTTINNNATGVISNTGGTGANREAIDFNGGTSILNNSGTVSSTNNTIFMDGGNVTINNAAGATISSTSTGNSTIIWATAGNIDNAGTITGALRAISLQSSGTLTNQAGATIESTGSNGAIYLVDGTVDINNSGNIINDTAGQSAITHNLASGDFQGAINNLAGGVIRGNQNGISMDEPGGSSTGEISGAITNAGTIQGTNGAGIFGRAIDTSSSSAEVSYSGGVVNTGTITGNRGIFLQGSIATIGLASISSIDNSGTIEGTGGTAIEFDAASGTTAININGGNIIGDVVDNFTNGHISNVTITGSGFDTEGDFTVSSLTVNAGEEFRISGDDTFNTNTLSLGAGSTLNIGIDAAGVAGNVNVTAGAVDLTGAAVGAEVNAAAPLVDGQEILIGTGTADVVGTTGATGQALETAADDSLLFDFEIADGGQVDITGSADASELYFLVTQAASAGGSAVTSNANGAGTAINTLMGTTNPQLSSILANVAAASTSEELEEVLQAVLPQVDTGALTAAQNVTGNTIRLVSDRLSTIRTTGGGQSGVSSGDLTENLQMWGQVFGQKADQGLRDGIAGFDSTTTGITVGADTEGLHDNATVGVAFSYAFTDVDSDNATNTQSDINSYNATLYGDYDLGNDIYVVGDIGYTYGDNETTRSNVGGVAGLNAKSDYGSHQAQARAIVARDYNLTKHEGVRVTPKALVKYTYYQNEDINETGAGGANLDVDSEALNIFEVGVGVDVRKDYVQDNGGVISPEVSAGYRYDLVGDAVQTTSTFEGGGPSFRSEGADPDQDTFNLGVGVGYTTPSSMEFTASYDYENKDEFDSHSAFIRLAAPF